MGDDDRAGFEYQGRFYPWSVSDIGKDLMLIDRIAQMSPSDFIEMMSDVDENTRAPVLLGLIATSLRAGHPDWSVERTYRVVMGLSLTADILFVGADDDEEEGEARPPAPGGLQISGPGRSPSNGSSQPSTPKERSTSPTSSATPP